MNWNLFRNQGSLGINSICLHGWNLQIRNNADPEDILWFFVLLGRGNSADNSGPILLPPRDYDTVHRHRGNLAGIEFRRCLNQNIVGGNTAIERGGTRSAASSGIGSATPPPYQSHHPLGPRPSRPSRDSSSGEFSFFFLILFLPQHWHSWFLSTTTFVVLWPWKIL